MRDIQVLMGWLNFASQFILDYKQCVKPLIALLGKNGRNRWTLEHTMCLNELAALVSNRLKLGLVDMK